MASDKLDTYRRKRDFGKTPEPDGAMASEKKRSAGKAASPPGGKALQFVVQKHAASHLHYDFRLELDGVMLSWALPKGPSFDPKHKRLAVQTEDHPVSYNSFEGTIPKGQYGAGTVIVWDRGSWIPEGDPHAGLAAGKLLFTLDGHKLAGLWELVRIAKGGEKQPPWIMFKKHDAFERPHAEYDVISALPDSVVRNPPASRPLPTAKNTGSTGGAGKASPTETLRLDKLAKKAPLPAKLAPQLATLSTSIPTSTAELPWLFEIKFDGYRLLTRIDANGKATLFTRNGHDWTAKMPRLAAALDGMGLRNCWLDGEIVVLDRNGVPDFNALQNSFDRVVGRGIAAEAAPTKHQLPGGAVGAASAALRVGKHSATAAEAAPTKHQPPAGAVGAASAALQIGKHSATAAEAAPTKHQPSRDAIVYFLFDLPFFDGRDLRPLALSDRRAALKQMLEGIADHPEIRLSADFDGDPAEILASAAKLKLEGLIAKRLDAPYVSARSPTWLKLKCKQRQEFVIAGFTDRGNKKDAAEIGSLLLGVVDNGVLVSVGSVGTGWNSSAAAELKSKLVAIERGDAAFGTAIAPEGAPTESRPKKRSVGAASAAIQFRNDGNVGVASAAIRADSQNPSAAEAAPTQSRSAKKSRWSKRKPGDERWVEPVLVAEVNFAEWTPDGQIRHASFVSLRSDKPAAEITRESPPSNAGSTPRSKAAGKQTVGAPSGAKSTSAQPSSSIKITHPDRVVDPSTKLTKLDLVRYYDSVADWILPHLKGRPCSLVRGPNGIAGQLFFQKHGDTLKIPGLKELSPDLMPDHEPLIEVPGVNALLGAAQMNVIEFHTCNGKAHNFDHPDRLIFDLDPGDGVAWKKVQDGAALLQSFLDELGLKCWLKTSGGKGLHVVVPLAPKHDWATVKDFSRDVVQHIARVIPDRFVSKSGPKNRVGKIFIDYLRNSRGATTVAAFSARSRPGLGVSVPIAWDQLPDIKSGAQWTIANAREYLSFESEDPWAAYWKSRQSLTRAIKRIADT